MKYFLPRILKKAQIIERFNLNQKIILNQKKFRIPIIKGLGFHNLFMTEIWMIDVLKKISKGKDETFIDVGVNIGQTLLKLRSVNKKGNYIGFEPNPSCLFYVEELIKRNEIQNVTILPVGISQEDNVLSLNLYSEKDPTDSSASIIENFRKDNVFKKKYVPVFKAKRFNNFFKKAGIIKIDVEGAELEVIESFTDVIKSDRPYILVEILPLYNKTNTDRIQRAKKIVTILKGLDYEIHQIIKKQDNSFDYFKKIEIIQIHSDLNLCDYLFLPKEKITEI